MRIRFRVKSRGEFSSRPRAPKTATVALLPLRADEVNDEQCANRALWGTLQPVGELNLAFCDPRMLQEFEPDTEVEITVRVITRED